MHILDRDASEARGAAAVASEGAYEGWIVNSFGSIAIRRKGGPSGGIKSQLAMFLSILEGDGPWGTSVVTNEGGGCS